jgi:hypothetical protein
VCLRLLYVVRELYRLPRTTFSRKYCASTASTIDAQETGIVGEFANRDQYLLIALRL